jgi:hypothetical protein
LWSSVQGHHAGGTATQTQFVEAELSRWRDNLMGIISE